MKRLLRLASIAFLLLAVNAFADLRLASIFSSNMVLQQEKPIVVWGWDAPGTQVTVTLGDKTAQATANAKGEWKATLAPMKADGKTYALTVKGTSAVVCENVVLGEVWLCSGQSNMEWGIRGVDDAATEIAAANYSNIRLFFVPKKFLASPTNAIPSAWKACTPATIVEGHSAVGYFFGRNIHTNLKVPVGLITSAWGGTRIEPWTVPEGFAMVPVLQSQLTQALAMDPRSALRKAALETYLKKLEAWAAEARASIASDSANAIAPPYPPELLPPTSQQQPSVLYNGMIHPLVPFAIRGALWYQGESNHPEGLLYTEKKKALILGWRKIWGDEFPFYFVQIAPYQYGNENPSILAEFWEAVDIATRVIPKVGMAVVNDIGNLKDIHPKNKQEVGRRLALHALAKDYGRKGLEWSGPTYKSHLVEGDKMKVSFDHVGAGLVSRDGKPLTWWELLDAKEGGWTPAEAVIQGAQVVVSAPSVKNPLAVRHAWHKLAEPNFMNKDGLPAVPFRAGAWTNRDALSLNVGELKDYQLVLQLDIAKVSGEPAYAVDNRATVKPFDRIAYYLELKGATGEAQWLWVSMDAYTADAAKLGVPTLANKAVFQQLLTGLNIYCNVPGVTTGTGLKGNIEFWTHNYGAANAKNVPNASANDYDFGDQMSDPENGHGSMQIHNYEARQVLFAMNGWKGGNPDLGIGNRPGEKNTDWTFAGNARSYTTKIMKVFVRLKP
ncbi:MAG: 9-O-acetylesterase [Spirochaetes bacterium]|nr:9-O-acetylesterase [Spirochaetota bacterium]